MNSNSTRENTKRLKTQNYCQTINEKNERKFFSAFEKNLLDLKPTLTFKMEMSQRRKSMEGNFEFYNPTKIYFGKGSISALKSELSHFGKRILLAYGTGSIKRNGIYSDVTKILKKSEKEIYELGGIHSNPSYESVLKGKELIEKNHIDFILAVGGGSVIDCAKAVAAVADF